MAKREFDLIIWGATGFTGQLVVAYLSRTYGVGGELNWAIAGRSREKLEQVRHDCLDAALHEQLPLVIADSGDAESLAAMVARTAVICTTVGPYAQYGTPLVAACAQAGTDYCDLTGEVQWMAKVIPAYQQMAEKSGARIVHTCGFDSIPSDLGTWFVQQQMLETPRGGGLPGKSTGGAHTWRRQWRHYSQYAQHDGGSGQGPLNTQVGGRPLCTLSRRASQRDPMAPTRWAHAIDEDFQQWTSPFVMAVVNTRVVRRSNALMGFPWGEDFRYDESLLSGSRLKATGIAVAAGAGIAALALSPTRKLAQRFLPAPGEGPNKKQREAGFYELFFYAVHPESKEKDMLVKVTGDMDPGYGSTSKMLGEAAVCLALDKPRVGGGCWTPASAMGQQLLDRLIENAGLTFEIVT